MADLKLDRNWPLSVGVSAKRNAYNSIYLLKCISAFDDGSKRLKYRRSRTISTRI